MVCLMLVIQLVRVCARNSPRSVSGNGQRACGHGHCGVGTCRRRVAWRLIIGCDVQIRAGRCRLEMDDSRSEVREEDARYVRSWRRRDGRVVKGRRHVSIRSWLIFEKGRMEGEPNKNNMINSIQSYTSGQAEHTGTDTYGPRTSAPLPAPRSRSYSATSANASKHNTGRVQAPNRGQRR